MSISKTRILREVEGVGNSISELPRLLAQLEVDDLMAATLIIPMT
jgi:hypothetical protein